MTIDADVSTEFGDSITNALEALRNNLKKLRTGRANIAILDGIRVDYYGSPTPLSQVAQLAVPDARMITVKPWEKGIIGDIEKAISAASIGITPMNDGEFIRLPIPQLTEERRKDLVKQAKGRGEDAKISVRNARRDANEMLKAAEKEKELSEDDLKRALDKIQDQTDVAVKKIDEVLGGKEKEILEI